MNLTLTRAASTSQGTPGVLIAGDLRLRTIEPQWLDNREDVSCVPPGTYQMLPFLSDKHGRTWRLHNPDLWVWGYVSEPPSASMRTAVEVHTGNTAADSEGCILVGQSASTMLDRTGHVVIAVLDSVPALEQLRDLLDPGEEDFLTISWDAGCAPVSR